jgi:hypothetical protein
MTVHDPATAVVLSQATTSLKDVVSVQFQLHFQICHTVKQNTKNPKQMNERIPKLPPLHQFLPLL